MGVYFNHDADAQHGVPGNLRVREWIANSVRAILLLNHHASFSISL